MAEADFDEQKEKRGLPSIGFIFPGMWLPLAASILPLAPLNCRHHSAYRVLDRSQVCAA
jgi:hypothetical protein